MEEVVLIEKNRPDWQKGLLNGVGGHVKEDEDSYQAMVREFHEETGLKFLDWEQFHVLNNPHFTVCCFKGVSEAWDMARTMTDEKIDIYSVAMLKKLNTIKNLQWLIPMCLDDQHIHGVSSTKIK